MNAPPETAVPEAGASVSLAAARAFVGALEELGVRQMVASPGSRSTPLVLAAAERAIPTTMVHDERSAAFFALGIARETARPVLVVCTSGTAAANFLPAVCEARLSSAPLLFVTADRPADARNCHAPQTIEQTNLFASHALASFEVPIQDAASCERTARYFAARAYAAAAVDGSGPVHVNFPFDEPLLDRSFDDSASGDRNGAGTSIAAPAATTVTAGPAALTRQQTEELARTLQGAERGLVIASGRALPAAELAALAEGLGWPLLADPLSGLRYGAGPGEKTVVIDAYDVLLRDPAFRTAQQPDLALVFGTPSASKALETFVEQHCPQRIVVGNADWSDPYHSASRLVRADPAGLSQALLECDLPAEGGSHRRDPARQEAWRECWIGASTRTRLAIDQAMAEEPELFGGTVAADVAGAIPEGTLLFVGNSMPVRDVDTWVGSRPTPFEVRANRGANGIDGVTSTALGAAASGRPTVLLTGDVSFLHDLGALVLASVHAIPLTIVVVNDDGGGIFSHLPQAVLGETFERLFATPHGRDLAAVASPFATRAARLDSRDELRRELDRALAEGGLQVIEVLVDRARSAALQRSHLARAQAARDGNDS